VDDGDRIVRREWRLHEDGTSQRVLAVYLAAEHPSPAAVDRLAREFALREELDRAWAAIPVELTREGGRHVLLLDDPGGEPLEQLIGEPMDAENFLRHAIGIAHALGEAHRRNLVHKDIKPGNILVHTDNAMPRLIGFGITTRIMRTRQTPEPPERIAGSLAYMAPEQTGRMNRSVDSRSDLYALGVTFYRMLTGCFPFTADDPMEWVHCHIARRPIPPAERVASVPSFISDIVMRLLVKAAEDRYQTAAGLEHDLEQLLRSPVPIHRFALGERDIPNHLLIPEKLYGRQAEVAALLAAFDRMVGGSAPELVLVSGYSGIGKSSVVNELHGPIVPPRGLFASGKFDQYKRDIPYATLTQALHGLVRMLLGKGEAELALWRDTLRQALEPNARLVTDLVPDLALIVGEQPAIPPLDAQQEKSRFHLVFRRFLGVFAKREHPLALFLDDLQWLDLATLDLIEDLLTSPDTRWLLLIGAYRDNEVDDAHPLLQRLHVIRDNGARIHEIRLRPLGLDHIRQLVADALHLPLGEALPLARLVHAKTDGNPFFVRQFLHALVDEGLVAFDEDAQRWRWDLHRIGARSYADNVADLMVRRIVRLPTRTQLALREFACLGNTASLATLAVVLQIPEDAVHATLLHAVELELVQRLPDGYKFAHDRVQEAAYGGIPVAHRPAMHLRLGRLLAAQRPLSEADDAIFDIVNHFNHGASLIESAADRERLAELNLAAGRRAKASSAYDAAAHYFSTGKALLSEDAWKTSHDLVFGLELDGAECALLTGASSDAEQLLAMLAPHAQDAVERSAVACLRMDLYITLDQLGNAVAIGLAYLRTLDIVWSAHPTDEETVLEFERTRSMLAALGGRDPRELGLMSDPVALASLEVLVKLMAPAHYTDRNLTALTACRAASISFEHGNSDASCIAYEFLAMIAARFGDYDGARQFCQIGYDLVETRGLKRFQARAYVDYASLGWMAHPRVSRDLARRAFAVANASGDLIYATHTWWVSISNRLAGGDPLEDVQREAEAGIAFARKVRFGFVVGILAAQLALVRTLRGLTRKFGEFDDDRPDDPTSGGQSADGMERARIECWYWIRTLQARFLAGDHMGAIEASTRAQPHLWTCPTNLEAADFHCYSALARAASISHAASEAPARELDSIAAHERQFALFARLNPDSFGSRAALIAAETCRITGRDRQAMDLYEEAIRAARDSDLVHIEALANELAARFYAERGFDRINGLYLRDARHCYLRWGADGKVRQLEDLHPFLRAEPRSPGEMSVIGTSVEQLDFATIVKVLEAASGEIVPERLITTIMQSAIEQAGAERGVLVLASSGESRVVAEAQTTTDTPLVRVRDEPVSAATLPETVMLYVTRVRVPLILGDACTESPFAEDPYVRARQVRSVLCLPLVKQAELVGALYLENNLAPRVFAPERTAVLKLLASQAAISLENTRLYADLQKREARIRRLVDSNIIGVFIWDSDGHIRNANDAFLGTVGYDRDDLDAGRLSWTALAPAEWLEGSRHHRMPKLDGTRSLQPVEKEYLRKDGSRVAVLVGVASYEDTANQGVAFVIDLTDRKRMEAAAREHDRRYRETQAELAHANRVVTMGQLTASIAHEVNQPITGTLTNAQVALRFLSADPPKLEKVREALERIVRDSTRAGAVVHRIRNLSKKAAHRDDPLEVNVAIQEVVELTQGEARKNAVAVRTEFMDGLPIVRGDRVGLQQVVLNLILNAIEAMADAPDGRRDLLIATSRTESGDVLIAVRDTGPGLQPESPDQLFAPFYTTKQNGLGMGLSICRSIIELHAGRLWANANEPHGAVFQFTLPTESGAPRDTKVS